MELHIPLMLNCGSAVRLSDKSQNPCGDLKWKDKTD